MNLREEVEEWIREIDYAAVFDDKDVRYRAQDILDMIEKRIDEYVKSKGWDDNDILEHWAITDIENLKKEMLK